MTDFGSSACDSHLVPGRDGGDPHAPGPISEIRRAPTLRGWRRDDSAIHLRIDGEIAEGGMGEVLSARDLDTGRRVAVKVLHARHAGDVGIAGRFAREIRFAERARHPHVIDMIGAGTLDDGRPFFVMELLRGMTLGALVRARGPLGLGRALRLFDQMLDGLAAVHEAGIVHRDLSPDNVFVAPAPDGGDRAVILDFGFAQERGADRGDGVTADSPGSLVGTLTFMAPEQAMRGRAIMPESDLFSAALLIHYALTGKLPFRGRDERDLLVSLVRAAPVPLRRELPGAPPALEAALLRALAKHPDARFSSARDMRAALLSIPA